MKTITGIRNQVDSVLEFHSIHTPNIFTLNNYKHVRKQKQILYLNLATVAIIRLQTTTTKITITTQIYRLFEIYFLQIRIKH